MDQKPQLPTQLSTKNEEERGGLDEEEIYEKIEAPKFVDFTAPDPYQPDDRYWFCLRVVPMRNAHFQLHQNLQSLESQDYL